MATATKKKKKQKQQASVNVKGRESEIINEMIRQTAIVDKANKAMDQLDAEFQESCYAAVAGSVHGVVYNDKEQLEVGISLIYKKLTPGKWELTGALKKQHVEVAEKVKKFKATHDPVSGKEEYWAISARKKK